MKKHIVRLFAYLVIIALVLQTTPIQALPITDASSAPRQDLTAWQLEPKLPHEALSPGEDLRPPAEEPESIPPTAAELALTAMQVRTFDCTTVTEVPTAECEALVALYDSTNGVAWTNSTNWLNTTTMGEWYGVTVLDGHISRLSLYSNQLSGSIPVEFGNLGSLQYVDMYDNLLTGSIPPELGNLGSLKKITLNSNQLTGLIPERLVDLENLFNVTGLNLSHNYLITNRYSQTLLDFLALKDPDWESTQENICNIVTEIPTSECEALVTLYNSTNGLGWTTQTNWLANNQPSTWYGVTVTGGHILSLTLGSNQLSGSLPAGLGDLSVLDYLNLSSNPLSGMIPLNFSNLESLNSFYFNSTSLCEPDSTEFIAWKATVTTWSGTDVVCDAFCLTVTDVPYHECDALKAFYVSTNGDGWTDKTNWLTSTTVGGWHGVTVAGGYVTGVDLPYNELSGSIPPELGNLGSLQRIDFNDNLLTGSIPLDLGNLGSLGYLDLAWNLLTGSIPAELGDLGSLQHLYLYGNQLTGSIPPELGNISSLVSLDFSDNHLAGIIPPELGDLSNLQYLYLEYNQLIGSIPTELGSLGNLKQLYLHHNQLTGIIPSELGDISSLTHLLLYENQLTGSIPAELGNLSNLVHLLLDSNQLTGSIPVALGSLSNLQALTLEFNQLSGSIPSALGSLSSLTHFYLGSNQLSGSIPPELGNLGSLNYFRLSSNQLSGSIPAALGNLSNLAYLHLDSNQLSGNIPPELGNISDLQELRLSSNQLTGSIPSGLGNLTRLYHVLLDQNKLSGDVPATFVNLVNLCTLDNTAYPCDGTKELDLGYNHLNVTAPEPPASFLAIKDPDWYLTQAVEKVIDGEIGGNLVSIDGTVKVDVPSEAVSGNVTFLLEPQPAPSQDTGVLGFAGKSFRLTAWDSLGNPVTVFNMGKKITVRITYDEGDLGNIPEEALRLYYWDEIDSAWEDVITDCQVGAYVRIPDVNWLFAPVCHLSEFALLGENVYTTYLPLLLR